MRRLMLLMVALCFLSALSGCKHVFTHGICDCDHDDPCASRSPWIRHGAPATPVETIPEPVPAKALPNVPKGL